MSLTLAKYHTAHGAKVADDGIPLHYTDLSTEYQAALDAAVLLDRSHEGRIRLRGANRAELLQRISTGDLLHLAPGEGRPTIFTTSTGRILDRAVVYHESAESLTLLTGPGRGQPLLDYLRRNIFFRDDVQPELLNPTTAQFGLHGALADAVAQALDPRTAALARYQSLHTEIAGADVFIARDKPLAGGHWTIITAADSAVPVWSALLEIGHPHGLLPAGSLTYNTLRIRAGVPGVGRELTGDYIPLELGLWDEISFNKGCYTGQEIIARMESRNRLAKTLVRLKLAAPVTAPADLLHEGKRAGTLTGSVTAPDGESFGMGVLKPSLAVPGQPLTAGGTAVTVVDLPGAQPPGLQDVDNTAE